MKKNTRFITYVETEFFFRLLQFWIIQVQIFSRFLKHSKHEDLEIFWELEKNLPYLKSVEVSEIIDIQEFLMKISFTKFYRVKFKRFIIYIYNILVVLYISKLQLFFAICYFNFFAFTYFSGIQWDMIR